MVIYSEGNDTLPWQIFGGYPGRVDNNPVEKFRKTVGCSYYLELGVGLGEVKLNCLNIFEVHPHCVHVCCVDCCLVLVYSDYSAFFEVFGEEKREDAAAAAQVEDIVSLLVDIFE